MSASNPELVNSAAGPPPPLPPIEKKCPEGYKKHQGACFKFGVHSSYEMAKSSCESVGARLVDIERNFAKYIRDQVKTMGGNDFWIGSFTNNGKTFRQKGSTSCPILKGQMINDAFYGLVDCNSSNRYICQKYGPQKTPGLQFNQDGVFFDGAYGVDPKLKTKQGFNLAPSSTTISTKAPANEESGGTSPVIYVVVTVVVVILAIVLLKLLFNRYVNSKKKKSDPTKDAKKPAENTGNGMVFSPNWRKNPDSKLSSVDSAVPPSPSMERRSNHSASDRQHHRKSGSLQESGQARRGRPTVNGSQLKSKPLHLSGDVTDTYQYKSKSMKASRDDYGHRIRGHRRTYSDPRSDYGRPAYGGDYGHRRRSSFHSEYSLSSVDSDESNYRGGRYGPRKVYQRYPSENHSQHYHMRANSRFSPPRRESHMPSHYGGGHYGRYHGRSSHSNVYHNDGHRYHSRQISHKSHRYADYGRTYAHGDRRRSHLPTISSKVPQNQPQERQYFPQPHRLMSWVDPVELKDSIEPLNPSTRSFPREPIRVNRQIHQSTKQQKHTTKRSKKSKAKDENHIYECLDEVKRNKQIKKAAKRNANRKIGGHEFKRDSSIRTSARSAVSIQSRRLPTPPT